MIYYSLNRYLQDVYGHKLYKLAIDGGFTCPNRDGTVGTGGCVFCSGSGSGDFAADRALTIAEQIEQAKTRVAGKIRNPDYPAYIAYFQAFTNTYGSIEDLKQKYLEAISHPDVAIISIATRPDCLSEEVVELLKYCNSIKPVWVELGLQTIHPQSAEYIRRGYELSVFDDAVERLSNAGISQIITHVILGLPGETKEMMLDTVKYVAGTRSNGIKLQLLHVLKGTDLETDYNNGLFRTLSLEEYCDIVVLALEMLPDNMVVHRITGDGDKKLLVAPEWSADKKRVLNTLNKLIASK